MNATGRVTHRFVSSAAGSVAVTFAVCAIPLIAAAAAGIDYARSLLSVGKIQSAMDAAVLAGLTASGSETSMAKTVFTGNVSDGSLTLNAPVFVFDKTCGCLTGSVSGSVSLAFARILPASAVTVSVTSKASNMKPRQRPVSFVTTPTKAQGWYPKVMSVWTKDTSGNIVSQSQLMTYDFRFPSNGWTSPPIGQASSTAVLDSSAAVWGISVINYYSASTSSYCPGFCGVSYTNTVTSPPTSAPTMAQMGAFRFTGDCTSSQGMTVNYEDGGDSSYMDLVATIRCTMGTVATKVAPYLTN
ncbi:pilus assembly protein TadG-related protein [Methylobacterium nonmethylotrophicum]|uniref:pilus assembly protein TadG-related protein n=1 Tax=Methylobacterium nonmethylotrophicum TaxID=1141884 RepID=UPI001436B08D|nr:pilus assembly protein TadG-related protein [Methylobacterium nonmethylotrophicum]